MAKYEHRSTHGVAEFDDNEALTYVDDPIPPSGEDNWRLVNTAMGPIYYGKCRLIWSWEREVTNER